MIHLNASDERGIDIIRKSNKSILLIPNHYFKMVLSL